MNENKQNSKNILGVVRQKVSFLAGSKYFELFILNSSIKDLKPPNTRISLAPSSISNKLLFFAFPPFSLSTPQLTAFFFNKFKAIIERKIKIQIGIKMFVPKVMKKNNSKEVKIINSADKYEKSDFQN